LIYTQNTQPNPDRIRNFALLIAYLNSIKKTPALKSQVLNYVSQLQEPDISTQKYREYII